MIDEKGENLGILSREVALQLSLEKGVDLIEIAPHAKPPVTRLMSFDKYRYQKEKKERKERLAQKHTGMKQVQISARAAHNDLLLRAHQAEKFLEEGHPVEIRLRLRGREKRNREWAAKRLAEFMKIITVEYKTLSEPKSSGFGITVQIVKK